MALMGGVRKGWRARTRAWRAMTVRHIAITRGSFTRPRPGSARTRVLPERARVEAPPKGSGSWEGHPRGGWSISLHARGARRHHSDVHDMGIQTCPQSNWAVDM